MAFGIDDLIGGGISLLGSLFGGGGGGSNNNALASLLSGQATAQRIPGQTRAGEYTPPEGGFGTYNYIPTGATQIDPALIQMILGSGANAGGINNTLSQYGSPLLQQGLNNPYLGDLQSTINNAGTNTAGAARGYQDLINTNMSRPLDMANAMTGMGERLVWDAYQNPFRQSAINNTANIGGQAMTQGAGLADTASGALGGASNIVGQLSNNPFLAQAQQGANAAGGMLQNTGQNQYGLGQTFTGQVAAGLPAASQILNTAFDPQQQLYNRTLQQTQDQIGSLLARTGTTDSGTGAKFASDALQNFNIDWQNNQLGRQTQGLNAYTAGMTGAGANIGTGTNLQSTGAGNVAAGAALPAKTYQGLGEMQLGNYGQLANLLPQLGGAMTTGANMGYQGAGAGSDAYMKSLTEQMPFGNFYAQTGQGVGAALTQLGQLGGAQAELGGTALDFSAMPYNFYNTNLGNQNTALSNYLTNQTSGANMTNNSIQQMLNYLGSVMNGSGNAANAASGAQGRTTDQNAAASAGLQPIISGGLDWLGKILFPQGNSSGFGSYNSGYNATRAANGW